MCPGSSSPGPAPCLPLPLAAGPQPALPPVPPVPSPPPPAASRSGQTPGHEPRVQAPGLGSCGRPASARLPSLHLEKDDGKGTRPLTPLTGGETEVRRSGLAAGRVGPSGQSPRPPGRPRSQPSPAPANFSTNRRVPFTSALGDHFRVPAGRGRARATSARDAAILAPGSGGPGLGRGLGGHVGVGQGVSYPVTLHWR